MQHIYLLCACFILLCTCLRAQDVDVTVSVDMTGQTIDPTGVYLVGGFNGWDPTATPMTETSPGSNIYTSVVSRPADDNIEYKVLNGNSYAGEEPTSPCSYPYNGNRVFTVPGAAASLPTFVFGGCPPGVGLVPVTFRVDASGQDVSNGVYVVGEMVGWNNPGSTPMTEIGNTGVYEATINLPADLLRINFKYLLGPNYDNAENANEGDCANGSDRFYRFTGGTEETEVYFFNTCDVSTVLPVVLTAFTATSSAKRITLNWATATEDLAHYFELERSTDGQQFDYLGTVDASGRADSEQHYELIDNTPAVGTNYYRLTTVDLDGTRHVEGVRTAQFTDDLSALRVFPNPVNDRLSVRFTGTANLVVIDKLGRILQQTTATDGIQLRTDALPAGHYTLLKRTLTGTTQTSFLKN